MLNIGWEAVDITPHDRTVSLYGQYYERLTHEIDCDILATAFAADNGSHAFTWVSCDLNIITAALTEDVRNAVKRKAPEISSENIVLSSTHTHSSLCEKLDPLLTGNKGYELPEGIMGISEYHDFITEKISDAVITANRKKSPDFIMQTGVSPVMTGYCRRGIIRGEEAVMYIDTKRPDFIRMESPDGGPVNIIYIKDTHGILRGVITCVPCPAQVLEHQYYITSDFPGRVRNLLWNQYGKDFLYFHLTASSGDLSPRNLVTRDHGTGNMYDRSGADDLAQRLFDAIISEEKRPVEHITHSQEIEFAKKRLRLPGWVPSEEEYRWALTLKDSDELKYDIKDYVQKGVEPYSRTPLNLSKRVHSILERYENIDFYREIEIELAAARFGNTVWISNPFELYQEHAVKIASGVQAKSLWSVQLTNAYLGYLPTKEAVRAGGFTGYAYTGWVDPVFGSEKFVKESIALADSMF